MKHALAAALAGLGLVAFATGTARSFETTSTEVKMKLITVPLRGDGTVSEAGRWAMLHGPLPRNAADVAAKAEANRQVDAALRKLKGVSRGAPETAVTRAPSITANFAGLGASGTSSPPDATLAASPSLYIQLVNKAFAFYDRTGLRTSTGSLNTLFNASSSASSGDPQVIWDDTTNRFYYAGYMLLSNTDNRLAWGFSKSATPANGTSDWCHYSFPYGGTWPDFPKLGDSRLFTMIGTNNFDAATRVYQRSELLSVRKPVGTGTISTCPATVGSCRAGWLMAGLTHLTWSPVPANSIDAVDDGYVVGRWDQLPSTQLIVHRVRGGSATTCPTVGGGMSVPVTSYAIPPDAVQPHFADGSPAPMLETQDARMTQAVMARNPARGSNLSLWTQQTILNDSGTQYARSKLRVYEIRPDTLTLLRQEHIASSGNFVFNGAVSPDRRLNATIGTGNNVIAGYSYAGPAVYPSFRASSSIAGGAFSTAIMRAGAGPYRDLSCPNTTDTCRWGDYSGAVPDPFPWTGGWSAFALTNQFSPGGAMPTDRGNWATRIVNVVP